MLARASGRARSLRLKPHILEAGQAKQGRATPCSFEEELRVYMGGHLQIADEPSFSHDISFCFSLNQQYNLLCADKSDRYF